MKQMHTILEDRDKNVREEGKKLMVELYRWIGQALKPQMSSLKPVQVSLVGHTPFITLGNLFHSPFFSVYNSPLTFQSIFCK